MDNASFRRTWAQIDLDALVSNFCVLRREINKNTKIMSVVKADAYGHGVKQVANELQNAGSDWFAVSSLDEGRQLRRLGITRPILILGYTPPELCKTVAVCGLTQAVFSAEYAQALSENALQANVTVDCHIKVDTGMGRLGFDAFDDCCAQEIARCCALGGINADGIFTHFPSADFDGDADGRITHSAFSLFNGIINQLANMGVHFSLRHCCNSAASLNAPEMQLDMVREGIVLYGLWPSKETARDIGLKPVMELKSVITMVKDLPAGRTVSYGRTAKTERPTKVATVCIGYADGYQRVLSQKGEMLVRGKKAPIIGRVCMDQLMLDVTDIEDVCAGDEVTVFGKSGDAFLPVEELAERSDTINYEFVCMLGKRVPRLYFKDGKLVSVTNYLNE